MRLIYLAVLILVSTSIFYFKDGLWSDFFGGWGEQSPIAKKISAVKPKSLINKAEALKPVSPQFTFFETLSDKTLTKYVGLQGEMLPVSLPAKPILNIQEKRPVRTVIEPKVKAKVEETVQKEKKPEPSLSKFAVQVSSFRDEKRAGALKIDLQKKGFDAFLMEAELPNHGGKWFRVFLGRYSDEDRARKDAERARQEHKLNAVVVRKTIE
ncbi:MAG: SPOR domain-containing protein [Nitrospinae bacterium]|nr:SPOR domain-containing protein [Nitrospinota bacterium]